MKFMAVDFFCLGLLRSLALGSEMESAVELHLRPSLQKDSRSKGVK